MKDRKRKAAATVGRGVKWVGRKVWDEGVDMSTRNHGTTAANSERGFLVVPTGLWRKAQEGNI